eukprot:scaffold2802_cov110-Isochrysis_galbana.AAC.9
MSSQVLCWSTSSAEASPERWRERKRISGLTSVFVVTARHLASRSSARRAWRAVGMRRQDKVHSTVVVVVEIKKNK